MILDLGWCILVFCFFLLLCVFVWTTVPDYYVLPLMEVGSYFKYVDKLNLNTASQIFDILLHSN